MVTIQRTQDRILTPGNLGAVQVYGTGGAAAVTDWWLGGGTISGANCLEHVATPSGGQAYTGASVAGGSPWTVAIRSNITALNTSEFAFDSQDGRVVFGHDKTDSGFYTTDSGWNDVNLFDGKGDHTWFIVSDGTNVQAYQDGSAVGASAASNEGLHQSGETRWRSRYNTPAISPWGEDLIVASVYDIALSVAQRAGLHTSMMAE